MQWSQRKDPDCREKNEDSSTESRQDHLGKGCKGQSHVGNTGWTAWSGEGPLKNDTLQRGTEAYPELPQAQRREQRRQGCRQGDELRGEHSCPPGMTARV